MNDRTLSNELISSCHVDERRLVLPTIKVFCEKEQNASPIARIRLQPLIRSPEWAAGQLIHFFGHAVIRDVARGQGPSHHAQAQTGLRCATGGRRVMGSAS